MVHHNIWTYFVKKDSTSTGLTQDGIKHVTYYQNNRCGELEYIVSWNGRMRILLRWLLIVSKKIDINNFAI